MLVYIFLACVLGVIVASIRQPHLWRDYRGWLGFTTNSNGSSYDSYQAYSGIIPALMIVTLIGAVVQSARHANCHEPGCWRIGHATPKGYKLCKIHLAKGLDELHLHEIHQDHLT